MKVKSMWGYSNSQKYCALSGSKYENSSGYILSLPTDLLHIVGHNGS